MKKELGDLRKQLNSEYLQIDPDRIAIKDPGLFSIEEREAILSQWGEYITINALITPRGEPIIERTDDVWKWKAREGVSLYGSGQTEEDFFAGSFPIYISLETKEGREKRMRQALQEMRTEILEQKWQTVLDNQGKAMEGIDHTNIKDKRELIRHLSLYKGYVDRIDLRRLEKESVKVLTLALLHARQRTQLPLDY